MIIIIENVHTQLYVKQYATIDIDSGTLKLDGPERCTMLECSPILTCMNAANPEHCSQINRR